jgi:hypothetical protein
MFRLVARVYNVKRSVASFEALLDEGQQYAILFLLRMEEGTDMARAA